MLFGFDKFRCFEGEIYSSVCLFPITLRERMEHNDTLASDE